MCPILFHHDLKVRNAELCLKALKTSIGDNNHFPLSKDQQSVARTSTDEKDICLTTGDFTYLIILVVGRELNVTHWTHRISHY